MIITMYKQPGLVALFGSGEISPIMHRVYNRLLHDLSQPIQIAVLETPAGFQPNTALVAEKVAEFLRHHMKNYRPQVTVVPARRRGTPYSPDNPDIVAPVVQSNMLFIGPGSPTYAVRQLSNSLAWHTTLAKHRLGASLALASAATIAASAHALPVYEIYKAGEDLHWHPGLDFFGHYNLSLVFIPHWNNREGGASLDTSRCYMGQARFDQLLRLLPPDVNILGIDEYTALVLDLAAGTCEVMGRGAVILIRNHTEQRFVRGKTFAITELGQFSMPEPQTGIPQEVWEQVSSAQAEASDEIAIPIPSQVMALVQERETARKRSDWTAADSLRELIAGMGWQVKDTPDGTELMPENEHQDS